MQRRTKIVLAVVLLAVAVVLVVRFVKQSGLGGPKEPAWYLEQPTEKIDCDSLQLITKTWGEWKSLGQKDGKYKNPETGKYTMVPTTRDRTTGKKIPAPASGPEASPQETTPKNLDPR